MAKRCYIDKNFKADSLTLIDTINDIIDEYRAQGFVLTVRQLYYQLVARDIIPNTINDYKRVASLVNDGKLAGLIDWAMLEDRTREFNEKQRWESPQEILRSSAYNYHEDMWSNQNHRVFVIVEKEALAGVLEGVCHDHDVPLLAARGYPSGSVLREFGVRQLRDSIRQNQTPIILHLGDHDPSGIDMTRDLQERLSLFAGDEVELRRIALNMPQVEEQRPPENPAKTTDSRFMEYQKRYGESSWELDALTPSYLAALVQENIEEFKDPDQWEEREAEVQAVIAKLTRIADDFEELN